IWHGPDDLACAPKLVRNLGVTCRSRKFLGIRSRGGIPRPTLQEDGLPRRRCELGGDEHKLRIVLLIAAAANFATAAFAQSQNIVMEEIMVPAADPGIEIYVRNKRPADLTAFRPERTVLFVHGATYPAHTSFDLKLDGLSWMDYIAARGYDVYLLDRRGYGKSTRPKEMDEKPEANPPLVRGDTAVKDIGTVVDFILRRRNIARLDLMGWSWGTTLMATYTTRNAAKVERLVL